MGVGDERGLSWVKSLGDSLRLCTPYTLPGILLHTVGVAGVRPGKVRPSGRFSDGWSAGRRGGGKDQK